MATNRHETEPAMPTDLLYGDEVYQIVGAAMEVRNELGFGFLEAVYQEAMLLELQLRGIPAQPQATFPILYKSRTLTKEYIADLLVFEKIIVELKALSELTGREESQLINYLRASRLKVGVLINFGSPRKLEWKRLIC